MLQIRNNNLSHALYNVTVRWVNSSVCEIHNSYTELTLWHIKGINYDITEDLGHVLALNHSPLLATYPRL